MSILNDAFQKGVTIVEAGPDVGVDAVFREMLEEFLTNRTRGVRREDLLRGAPWEDEETGRHYFRLMDLMKFLTRQGSKMQRNEVTTRLKKDYGAEPNFQLKVKGDMNIRAWWIPVDKIDRAPELDAPEQEEDAI